MTRCPTLLRLRVCLLELHQPRQETDAFFTTLDESLRSLLDPNPELMGSLEHALRRFLGSDANGLAERMCGTLVARSDATLPLLSNCGLTLPRLQELDGAIGRFRRALTLDPSDALAALDGPTGRGPSSLAAMARSPSPRARLRGRGRLPGGAEGVPESPRALGPRLAAALDACIGALASPDRSIRRTLIVRLAVDGSVAEAMLAEPGSGSACFAARLRSASPPVPSAADWWLVYDLTIEE